AQDADPAERIIALVDPERRFGNCGAADAVEAVAASDEIAGQRLVASLLAEPNAGRRRVEPFDRNRLGLEANVASACETRGDQVLADWGLAVDDDALVVGQVGERAGVAHALETQRKTMVHEPLAREPIADAEVVEEIDGALLEQAGALALFAVGAAFRLQQDA